MSKRLKAKIKSVRSHPESPRTAQLVWTLVVGLAVAAFALQHALSPHRSHFNEAVLTTPPASRTPAALGFTDFSPGH